MNLCPFQIVLENRNFMILHHNVKSPVFHFLKCQIRVLRGSKLQYKTYDKAIINCKNMATEAGWMPYFRRLHSCVLFCFYAFLLYFPYFKIFGIKIAFSVNSVIFPDSVISFLFSVSRKTGDSTIMYNNVTICEDAMTLASAMAMGSSPLSPSIVMSPTSLSKRSASTVSARVSNSVPCCKILVRTSMKAALVWTSGW